MNSSHLAVEPPSGLCLYTYTCIFKYIWYSRARQNLVTHYNFCAIQALGRNLMFEFSWFWLGLGVLLAYLVLSFRILQYNQVGAIFFLGYPWKEVGPGGLCFVPFLISWAQLFSTNAFQLELPGEPERVQKTDQDNLREGMRPPIRTTQAEAESALYWYETEDTREWRFKKFQEFEEVEQKAILADPLHHRLTTEPVVIVRWRLRRVENGDTLFKFIENIGSVEEANRQIEDTVVATLRTNFAKVTAGNALSAMAFFNQRIRERVEILIGERPDETGVLREAPWGIELLDVQIKDIDPGKTINTSLSGAAAAIKDKEAAIRKAEGDKAREVLIGEGRAEAIRKVGEALSTPDGLLAGQLQAGIEVAKEADFMILPEAYGLIGSFAKTLERVQHRKER